MTNIRQLPQSINQCQPLPWWFARQHPEVNANFEQRVVSLPQHARWHSTQIEGVDLRVLEYIPGDTPRLSAQLRIDPASSPAVLANNPALEIFMQRGELASESGVFPASLYLRLPLPEASTQQTLVFHCSRKSATASNADRLPGLLYLAAGQMLVSDTAERHLDTTDESRWLPGPASGTEVMPLHVHGTGNVMLIRWNTSIAFKPGLDPMGEEIFVLTGMLHDAQGHYPAGSWIRNPIAAWQSWGANAGTVVYYKNGHFSAPTLTP